MIDFVGEGDAIAQSVGMLRKGGTYWVVGYGGRIEVPAIDMIFSEIAVVGSLVGNYNELAELMVMAGQGRVRCTRPSTGWTTSTRPSTTWRAGASRDAG